MTTDDANMPAQLLRIEFWPRWREHFATPFASKHTDLCAPFQCLSLQMLDFFELHVHTSCRNTFSWVACNLKYKNQWSVRATIDAYQSRLRSSWQIIDFGRHKDHSATSNDYNWPRTQRKGFINRNLPSFAPTSYCSMWCIITSSDNLSTLYTAWYHVFMHTNKA